MASFFRKEDTLLTSQNCTLLLVDYQPQMLFAVKSINSDTLVNNAIGLAKAAKIFKVPTLLTSISQKSFNGKIFHPLQKVLSQAPVMDRMNMNAWEDNQVVEAVRRTKRDKLIIAGLWTEVSVALPTIKALESGYTVYVVADACGGTTQVAHQMAMERMIQAGAIPLTWLQLMMELQRDWSREETASAVLDVALEHAGTYGVGIEYSREQVSAVPLEEGNFVI